MFHKILRISAVVAAIALAVGVTFSAKVSALFQHEHSALQTTTAGTEREVLYWYDAMSPQHHYDKPGKAPDGMDLVPQYAEGNASQKDSATAAAAMPAGSVQIAADKQQLIGVRTGPVERHSLVRVVRTTGQLTADETKLAHIHVKVNGYIDKVFVDYVGQLVKKGIRYSPCTAQTS